MPYLSATSPKWFQAALWTDAVLSGGRSFACKPVRKLSVNPTIKSVRCSLRSRRLLEEERQAIRSHRFEGHTSSLYRSFQAGVAVCAIKPLLGSLALIHGHERLGFGALDQDDSRDQDHDRDKDGCLSPVHKPASASFRLLGGFEINNLRSSRKLSVGPIPSSVTLRDSLVMQSPNFWQLTWQKGGDKARLKQARLKQARFKQQSQAVGQPRIVSRPLIAATPAELDTPAHAC
jgi:hypothetical protein